MVAQGSPTKFLRVLHWLPVYEATGQQALRGQVRCQRKRKKRKVRCIIKPAMPLGVGQSLTLGRPTRDRASPLFTPRRSPARGKPPSLTAPDLPGVPVLVIYEQLGPRRRRSMSRPVPSPQPRIPTSFVRGQSAPLTSHLVIAPCPISASPHTAQVPTTYNGHKPKSKQRRTREGSHDRQRSSHGSGPPNRSLVPSAGTSPCAVPAAAAEPPCRPGRRKCGPPFARSTNPPPSFR